MILTAHIKYNKIIKRFSQVGPGGKKLGEKMAETMSKTSAAHPTIAPKNPNKGLPKYSTQCDTKNQDDKTTYSSSTWHSTGVELKNKLPPASPPKLSITGKIPQAIGGKDTGYGEIKIIAVKLHASEEEKKTLEAKHICLGAQQTDDSIVISSYLTSAAAHPPNKHNHGLPQNVRINNKKVDGTYVPEKEKVKGSDDQGNAIIIKREIRIPAADNEDGGGMAVPSATKGGQYLRKLSKEIIVKKGGYIENKAVTAYIRKDRDIYENVKAFI